MENEKFMLQALVEAKKAFGKGEVPVGAVLVKEGEIIARAHNLTESQRDATAHAELLCIRKASQKLSNWRLTGSTLYTTLEPCSMCAGSLLLSRVDTVIWGAADFRHGAVESFIDLLKRDHPTHQIQSLGGVLAEECGALLRNFFTLRRKENEERRKSIR